MYALCSPERERDIYDLFGEKLFRKAGIRLPHSRRYVRSNGGIGPVSVGVKILGSPGTHEFCLEASRERLEEETQLWRAMPSMPDLQCAWRLLVQCAGLRCHHCNVSHEHSAVYAQGHDRGEA